jgi:hypothetical protein
LTDIGFSITKTVSVRKEYRFQRLKTSARQHGSAGFPPQLVPSPRLFYIISPPSGLIFQIGYKKIALVKKFV